MMNGSGGPGSAAEGAGVVAKAPRTSASTPALPADAPTPPSKSGQGGPLSEPDVLASVCTFDEEEMRWLPQGEPVRIRLLRASAGAWRLDLGRDGAGAGAGAGGGGGASSAAPGVPLSDIRTVSRPGTGRLIALEVAGIGHAGLRCQSAEAAESFFGEISRRKADYERFESYDQRSVQTYFQYYGKLPNQQNMLQDTTRTSLYRRAIIENPSDFQGASVMDLGAGSGILSFFAAQASAARVYAVEASSMAEVVRQLADANAQCFPCGEVHVVAKPIELVTEEDISGRVDVLVSEPIGTFLFNERMIESYLVARDRFLKPGGKMFPNIGDLFLAPFSDSIMHWEQNNKNTFWKNTNFWGLDLTSAAKRCTEEQFRKPVVDYINPDCLVSPAQVKRFDFATITIESLHVIEIPFDFEIQQPCLVHGLAGWFDALFEGSDVTINLSTAPWCPGTHWYQTRLLLETPLAVNAGQRIEGKLKMEANSQQSYFMRFHMQIKGTSVSSQSQLIDLKDPEYRFYTSQNSYCPPGMAGIWQQQTAQQGGVGSLQQAQAANAATTAGSGRSGTLAGQQRQEEQFWSQVDGCGA